ncbi:protein-tyrosine phosphatase [Arcicella rosea]|uniref:low molecular weight protein-tyrosine-phosphatase n=1 Tax=Arcicella rosea TaxID=502909 RepID=UPI00345DC5C5
MMLKILFVCTGNICRSPIAEETFRRAVKARGLQRVIQCDSAATHAYHIGDLPDPRTRKNAELHGLELTHHCRKLSGEDFSVFDYIVAMDNYNMENIQTISARSIGIKQAEENCFLYRKFDNVLQNKVMEVPDPYYGNSDNFEEVYQIVNRCADTFLDFLIDKHHL